MHLVDWLRFSFVLVWHLAWTFIDLLKSLRPNGYNEITFTARFTSRRQILESYRPRSRK